MLIRKEIQCNAIQLPSYDSAKVDAVACQIPLHNDLSMGLLCIYRPPNIQISENEVLCNLIHAFLDKNFHYNIIVGDFNFPEIEWPSFASSSQGEVFLSFTQENFLEQHVAQVTRRSSHTTLDLVFTTPGTRVNGLKINEEFANSDHSIIQFNVSLRVKRLRKRKKVRNLGKVNWSEFELLLTQYLVDWKACLESEDIESVWEYFLDGVNSALDVIAPYCEVSERNFKSSSKVRTALRYKRRNFRAFNSHPSAISLMNYVRSAAIADKVIHTDTIFRENNIVVR